MSIVRDRRSQTERTKLLLPSVAVPSRTVDDDTQPETQRGLIFWLIVVVWLASVLFGSFTLLHYLTAYFFATCPDDTCIQAAWDRSDANLYRSKIPVANRIMVAHLIGGVFLMIAGPIQLIASIRRKHRNMHRWIGRVYIVSALISSACATIWTVMWRTSRCNRHEDVGNLILGISVFVSAIQTYRHAAITKQISSHQLWAWRLYACIFGAPLYRFYAAIYGALVLYTPWNGSLWIENALFYIIVLPNLILVQVLWQRKAEREADGLPSDDLKIAPIWIKIALAFVFASSSAIFFVQWLPAILGEDTGVVGNILHDFCTND